MLCIPAVFYFILGLSLYIIYNRRPIGDNNPPRKIVNKVKKKTEVYPFMKKASVICITRGIKQESEEEYKILNPYQPINGIQYETQLDEFSCGPVVVRNAYRWKYGRDPPYSISLRQLRKECYTNKIVGTEHWNLLNIAKDLLNPILTFNIDKMKDALYNGDGLILLYSFTTEKESGAHYNFCFLSDDGLVIIVNDNDGFDNHCHLEFPWELFRHHFLKTNPRRENDPWYPMAWIIKKEKTLIKMEC